MVLVDAYDAAAMLQIRPDLIRLWAHRGLIRRHGYDRSGRALFDWEELRRRVALAETAKR